MRQKRNWRERSLAPLAPLAAAAETSLRMFCAAHCALCPLPKGFRITGRGLPARRLGAPCWLTAAEAAQVLRCIRNAESGVAEQCVCDGVDAAAAAAPAASVCRKTK